MAESSQSISRLPCSGSIVDQATSDVRTTLGLTLRINRLHLRPSIGNSVLGIVGRPKVQLGAAAARCHAKRFLFDGCAPSRDRYVTAISL
jgi:hypothetical protein